MTIKTGLDVKIQQLSTIAIFLVTGWIIAGLALSGDVVQNTAPLKVEALAASLAVSSGNIILTLVLALFSLLLYWFVSKRKYLVEWIRVTFSRKRTDLPQPKGGLLGYAFGFFMLIGALLTLRYLGVLPGSLPLQSIGNITVGPILPPTGSNIPNAQAGLAATYHSLVTLSLVIVVFATAGVIVLIFMMGLAQLRAPGPSEPPVGSAIAKETIRVVREVARDLKENNDYRRTVLECYLQLCTIFDTQNEVGHRLLTARELQNAMTKQFPAAMMPISRLTLLFEEARYSSHAISPNMKDSAIKALKEIEDSLRNSSEVTPEAIY